MCKWCENYRFTINATSKKNLIDHGDFYVHANYCPVCGRNLNLNKVEEENTKEQNKKEQKVFLAKINANFIKGSNPEECYYKGMSTFGDTPLVTDKDGAKYFTSKTTLKQELNWFYNPEDYEIIPTIRVVTEMPMKEIKVKLPYFTEEDFYLKSDSGSVIRSVYDKDTNKRYVFSPKTIDKINQVVDKLNKLLN